MAAAAQLRFRFAPIRVELFLQGIESLAVIKLPQMTDLVRNDIINAVLRRLDQVRVQRNAAF